jgi:hypothetical protein
VVDRNTKTAFGRFFVFQAGICTASLIQPMRFRLLRRRLTISAPRVAVRSALPWPLRWIMLALVLGFCAAIALWAFEFGKGIAGLDSGSREELASLRAELSRLQGENLEQRAVAQVADSLLTAERAARDGMAAQVRQLESENRSLRDDLGFFERLLPMAKSDGLAIRALQADVLSEAQLRWQVLVIQPKPNAAEFKGRFELLLAGEREGQPWSQVMPAEGQALQFRQYRRLMGVLELPAQTVVKTVTARVLEGTQVRAQQTLTLDVAASRSP